MKKKKKIYAIKNFILIYINNGLVWQRQHRSSVRVPYINVALEAIASCAKMNYYYY